MPLIYSGDPHTKLDIIFVASHFYTETGPGSKFADDVDLVMGMFLSFPQYADNIGKVNFYRLDYIDPDDDCREVSYNPVCYDKDKLRAMASQCTGYNFDSNDQVVVMFDQQNTNLRYARAEPGFVFLPSDGWYWGVHEFGHSFGGLGDEYDAQNSCSIDPPYVNLASDTPGYTCWDKWGDLMGEQGVGCYPGGLCAGWYTPTEYDCVMNHPAVTHHCAVCARHVNSLLNIYIDVPVFVNSFVAVPVELSVELTWEIVADEGVTGFRIHRNTEGREGDEVLMPPGLLGPFVRSYRDDGVHGGRTYEYTLGVVLADRSEVMSQTVTVRTKAYALALYQNTPNPFNPATTISFTLPERSSVTLSIYDVEGRLVRTLVDEVVGEGYQERTWDGTDASGSQVGSGVYFYRLTAGDRTLTKKMVLLR